MVVLVSEEAVVSRLDDEVEGWLAVTESDGRCDGLGTDLYMKSFFSAFSSSERGGSSHAYNVCLLLTSTTFAGPRLRQSREEMALATPSSTMAASRRWKAAR